MTERSQLPQPIDWTAFWAEERAFQSWTVEPILPEGRQAVIFAPAKVGKSLLTLDIAAALATGRPILGRESGHPLDVVYIDAEMTADDLEERLVSLGFGADDDLSRLHYYLLPLLPPLDSDAGGLALEEIVKRHDASVVVLDTMARVVDGDENDANTYRNFASYTGLRLKRLGVGLLRLDHAGKDETRGQRGSSAKKDDVDVIWRMSIKDEQLKLEATSRVSWVPKLVRVGRATDETGQLRHTWIRAQTDCHEGAAELAVTMNEIGVPPNAKVKEAAALLRAAGKGRRTAVVSAALKLRRTAPNSGNGVGNGAGNDDRKR